MNSQPWYFATFLRSVLQVSKSILPLFPVPGSFMHSFLSFWQYFASFLSRSCSWQYSASFPSSLKCSASFPNSSEYSHLPSVPGSILHLTSSPGGILHLFLAVFAFTFSQFLAVVCIPCFVFFRILQRFSIHRDKNNCGGKVFRKGRF